MGVRSSSLLALSDARRMDGLRLRPVRRPCLCKSGSKLAALQTLRDLVANFNRPQWRCSSINSELMLIAFNKPFGVVSQFTADGSQHRTLADFGFPAGVYPLGRLDADSEGLLLLSDEPELNEKLLHPRHAHRRVYWAQVERVPSPQALAAMKKGLQIQERNTLPCRAWILEPQPEPPPRQPPIRFRKTVPACWIGLELVEGKNRQVRRMTAAVGHPTLRLVRVRIGEFELGDLPAGKWKELSAGERKQVLAPKAMR